MKLRGEKPDQQRILGGLKDFQRDTVEYVFRRLYKDIDKVNRFLISDEVGLGKTLVSRGVIVKAIEELWEQVKRIDIIYICSNADIARQNINRLNITGEKDFSFASRMTMLPVYLGRFRENKINFISFSPGTSFDLRSKGGIIDERVVLYHMLRNGFNYGEKAALKNIFQVYVEKKERWRNQLDSFDKDIDQGIQNTFIHTIRKNKKLMSELDELLDRFANYKKKISDRDRKKQLDFIGTLRRVLAEICIKKLEPDVIVLDEFQRFKNLLDGEDEIANLAKQLFDYKNKEVDAKILLLSATPYKMYTMYHETEDAHYEDLFRTLRFLNESDEKTEEIRASIKQYRDAIFEYTQGKTAPLAYAKEQVENSLKKYMVRTERLSVTHDRSGMVDEEHDNFGKVQPQDLHAFTLVDKISKLVKTHDTVEYWKSAPYMLNIMDKSGYKIKREFSHKHAHDEVRTELARLIQDGKDYMLSWKDIQQYKRIDPQNARMRYLIEHAVENGSVDLLWIPTSLPYYNTTEGPYAKIAENTITKSLVFSSWQVVPKAIAQFCSYEAERKLNQKLGSPSLYEDLTAKRKPLINFTVNEKAEYTGLSNFTLMYPCLTLAREVDPLIEGFGNSTQKKTLHYSEVFSSIKEKIQNMLYPIIEKYNIQSGQKAVRTQTPVRWYWLSMVLLDQHFYHDYYLVWLDQDNNENNWRDMITSRNQEEDDTAFSEHIDYLHEFFKNQNMFNDIGDPPEDLYDVLTEIAIGSPALIVLRSLMRQVDLKDPSIYINHLLSSSAFAAVHFRTLFNLPYAISVVQKYSNKDYWRAVLEYCTRGNLQAVVDEYTHVLKESLGLIDSSPGEIFSSITEELGIALSLRTVNLKFDHFEVNEDKIIESTSHTLRCRYALNFGAAETDDGTRSRPDHVRKAFNSPFQPFILATTSIGQEGLDFHHYCHNIYHWNLPTNPVDMEQREGRVHRYKGHAVRLNCVDEVPPSILRESIENLQDPWKIIFSYCEKNRPDEVNDLVPYWININNGGHPKYRICRHIPTLPLSREVTQLRNLRRSLVAYRMVFGQPRQEDLIHYLQERDSENKLDLEELLKYRIDLSP